MSGATASGPIRDQPRRVIGAAALGAAFEWYDFYLFAVLAPVFSATFFAGGSEAAALVASLLAFAAGFVVRPVGALVFGRLGDLIGRKYTFLATLLLMGAATLGVGVLPGQGTIGVAAPILLVLLRLLQGLAIGGEYGGVATYVAEHAPPGQRGLYTGWIQATASLGLLGALLTSVVLRSALGDAAFAEWGWRLPFVGSVLLLAIGIWMRLSLRESPLFYAMKKRGDTARAPLREAFGDRANVVRMLLVLLGLVAGQAAVWYTGQFGALYFLTIQHHVDESTAALLLGTAIALAAPLFVVFGAWSDRIGRKPLVVGGCALAAIVWWPIFRLLEATVRSDGSVHAIGAIACLFALMLLVAMVYAPIAAMLTESFAARVRCTSVGLPYHLGNGWVGGLLPGAMLALAARSGAPMAGLWLPIGIALASAAIGFVAIRESRDHPLG